MTRVLLVYDGFYRASGGVETHLLDLLRGLPHDFGILTNRFPDDIAYAPDALGGRVELLNIGPEDPAPSPRWTLRASRAGFPFRLAADYLRLWTKSRRIRADRWDVYHFHGHNVGSAISRWARILSSTRLVPPWLLDAAPRERRVLTVHGMSSRIVRSPLVEKLETMTLSHFPHVICVDRHLLQAVEAIAEEQSLDLEAEYIPNSVDTERFAYAPLGERGNLRIGFAGRAEMSRGLEWLTHLAGILPERVELHLAFAGNWTDLSRLPTSLIRRARTVRTNLPLEEMPGFYRDVDLVVNPVLAEGISRTTLEAMSVGRPSIMLRRGDRYPVVPGETGFLVERAEEGATVLTELLSDRDPLYAMSRRCRSVVEREFDCSVLLPRVNRVYETVGAPG